MVILLPVMVKSKLDLKGMAMSVAVANIILHSAIDALNQYAACCCYQGASSDQVDTVSYGEEKPKEMGHDDAAWSKNRRVELIYTVN